LAGRVPALRSKGTAGPPPRIPDPAVCVVATIRPGLRRQPTGAPSAIT